MRPFCFHIPLLKWLAVLKWTGHEFHWYQPPLGYQPGRRRPAAADAKLQTSYYGWQA